MLFAQHSVQEFLHKDGLVLSFKYRAHRPTSRLPSGLALHFPWRQQYRGCCFQGGSNSPWARRLPPRMFLIPETENPAAIGISMQRKIKQLIKILQNGRQRISSQEVRRDLPNPEISP